MADEFRSVKLTDAWLEGPRLRALRLDVSGTDFAERFTTPGQFVKVRIPGDLNSLFMALANASTLSSVPRLRSERNASSWACFSENAVHPSTVANTGVVELELWSTVRSAAASSG